MDPYGPLDAPVSRPMPAPLIDRLQFAVGRWVDERSLAYETWRIGRTSPERIRRRARRYREAVEHLDVRGILDRPIRLFDDACAVPAMERRDRRFFGLPACESLRFESRPPTVFPESFATAAHDPTRRNHFARAYRWSHGRGDHPAVLCIHGYRGGFPGFDGRAFDVPRLFGTLGFDVVLATLPYHGARAPEATGSGARFLDDPLRTLEAVVQAIGDLRAIAAWLRSQGASSVGVIGMSLGGYLAALLASVEPTLDFAVPVIPVASFADILWDRAVRRGEREDAQAAGVDLGLLRRLFSVHCPLSHSPVVAERRRLVIAGEGDRIVPPQHPAALAAHWRAPLEWFPGGHLLQLGRERALRRLAEIAAAA